jgi:predicted AAA+ superfamily ATPase
MKISREELIPILSQFNPWWRGEKIPDLPSWHRKSFKELFRWIESPPTPRAVLLSGPRQVGKTTLLLQSIQKLLDSGTPPSNILYATFDHPICKLVGLEAILEAWMELEPRSPGPEYLFLDEAQFIKDVGSWVKHQVDFFKTKRIVFTGSATPLIQTNQESGVGRWHTLRLSTLSFYEYLKIKKIELPKIPVLENLESLATASKGDYNQMSAAVSSLIGHFHEYLIRGGFLFIFLCMHDGGMQDISTISKDLGIAKQTVLNFIELLESAHLIYKIPPYGYGKEVLRGKNKLYLTDPAIAPAVLMKGKRILEDERALGQCVETAIVGHLYSHYDSGQARFSYWRNPKNKEVDLCVEVNERIIPFEVKYQTQHVQARDVPGLIDLCSQKASIGQGYIITKSPQDIGLLQTKTSQKSCIRVPAALFCYWMGASNTL